MTSTVSEIERVLAIDKQCREKAYTHMWLIMKHIFEKPQNAFQNGKKYVSIFFQYKVVELHFL